MESYPAEGVERRAFNRALAKAQSDIRAALKDRSNDHFHSQYATLASVWDACRGPLTANGFAVVQLPRADGAKVTVETRLLHESGHEIVGELTLQARAADTQAVGSAITYARRYGLASMVGVAPDDDDGNSATGKPARAMSPAPPPKAEIRPAPKAAAAPSDKDQHPAVAELMGVLKRDIGAETREDANTVLAWIAPGLDLAKARQPSVAEHVLAELKQLQLAGTPCSAMLAEARASEGERGG